MENIFEISLDFIADFIPTESDMEAMNQWYIERGYL